MSSDKRILFKILVLIGILAIVNCYDNAEGLVSYFAEI